MDSTVLLFPIFKVDHLFKPTQFLYFSSNSIPDMQVVAIETVHLEVTLPLHVNHKSIVSVDVAPFLREYCERLMDSMILEQDAHIVEKQIAIQRENASWNLYILHSNQKQVDGLAHFHYPLKWILIDGESLEEAKKSIVECYYRLLVQSVHISVVSGCRIE